MEIITPEGRYVHCALCSGMFWTRWPHDTDYCEYCTQCRRSPRIADNDVIDAHETLRAITLMSTLLRVLRVKEVYYRAP